MGAALEKDRPRSASAIRFTDYLYTIQAKKNGFVGTSRSRHWFTGRRGLRIIACQRPQHRLFRFRERFQGSKQAIDQGLKVITCPLLRFGGPSRTRWPPLGQTILGTVTEPKLDILLSRLDLGTHPRPGAGLANRQPQFPITAARTFSSQLQPGGEKRGSNSGRHRCNARVRPGLDGGEKLPLDFGG